MTLSVGIMGCGKATRQYHLPVIPALSELELSWVCDINEEQACEIGTVHEVDYYTDANEAIKKTPDIVHINTPPFFHADLAKAALDAGAHVLVEKPMAMTVEECDEMASAAQSSGRKLCVVHNNLFFDPMWSVIKNIEAGKYGDLVNVTSFLGGSPDPTPEKRGWVEGSHGGGALSDRLPHPIYLATHFLDNVGDASVRVRMENDVALDVSIQLAGQHTFGQVQASQRAIPAKEVYVTGTKRRAYIDLLNFVSVEYDTVDRSPVTIFSDNLSAAGQLTFQSVTNAINYAREIPGRGNRFAAPGHHRLMAHFVHSIEKDLAPPVGPKEGRKVVHLLQEIDDQTSSIS